LETFLTIADKSELVPIRSTPNLWAEIRWAARKEAIVHLDDLLLRRVRLGLLLPCHGFSVIERIRSIVQVELGWDDERWAEQVKIYRNLIDKSYSLEPGTNYKN
jgi:glycerol-3-phosphate dehydrogenase